MLRTFHFHLDQVSENWEQFCLPEAFGGPPEPSPLGRFWLGVGVPVQALSGVVGKGQGSGFKSRSRPSPGQQMTYRTKSPSMGDPRFKRAGDGREQGLPPEGPVTWSMRGAWTGSAYGEKCPWASLQLNME